METHDPTDSESEAEESHSGPDLRSLYAKLEDLQTCHDLIKKHASSLQRVVTDLDDDISRALSEKAGSLKHIIICMCDLFSKNAVEQIGFSKVPI